MKLDPKPEAVAVASVAVEAAALAAAAVVMAVAVEAAEEAAIAAAVEAAGADTKDPESKEDAGFWPASLNFCCVVQLIRTLRRACAE